jgi:rhodanese-related sulfurtransferase
MAKSFRDLVAEARADVPALTPEAAQARLAADPDVLVIDVQDHEDSVASGLIPGAVNISLGMLPIKADRELPAELTDPRLQDRSRPVITTCGAGGQAALAAKLLKDMGFTDVAFIDGGMRAWKERGLPVE